MITSERLPTAWIWRTTRPKRRSEAGTATSSSAVKKAACPRLRSSDSDCAPSLCRRDAQAEVMATHR